MNHGTRPKNRATWVLDRGPIQRRHWPRGRISSGKHFRAPRNHHHACRCEGGGSLGGDAIGPAGHGAGEIVSWTSALGKWQEESAIQIPFAQTNRLRHGGCVLLRGVG